MTKFYRAACFRQIGGFVRELMWTASTATRCRQLGWIASPGRPRVAVRPLTAMGTSHKNWWTGRMRHGFDSTSWVPPGYMLASAAYRMMRPPLLVGGMAMLHGYFKSMIQHEARYGDGEFRRFLRSYQWPACGRARPSRRRAERPPGGAVGSADKPT